jgi:hypothetical protein
MSMPAEAVTSGGSVSDTSGSITASVGRSRQWPKPVLTLSDSTSRTHIAVLSEPVPAVVGTAIRGLSWRWGARPRPIGLLT